VIKSERPHGYARYKLDNCRCYTCAQAVADLYDRLSMTPSTGPYARPGPRDGPEARVAAAAGLGRRTARRAGREGAA
jgi:hypothetical protein